MSEVDDRVPNQLAWTVIGGFTATVGPDHVDLAAQPLALIPQNVVSAGRLAHRENVRVLEQQQGVGRASVPDGGHDLRLEVPGLLVGGTTQPAGSYVLGLAHLRGMTI